MIPTQRNGQYKHRETYQFILQGSNEKRFRSRNGHFSVSLTENESISHNPFEFSVYRDIP